MPQQVKRNLTVLHQKATDSNTNLLTNADKERFEREPPHTCTFPHADYDGCHFCLRLGCARFSLSQTGSVSAGKGAAAGLRNKLKPIWSLCCVPDVSRALSGKRYSSWKQDMADVIVRKVSQTLQSYLLFFFLFLLLCGTYVLFSFLLLLLFSSALNILHISRMGVYFFIVFYKFLFSNMCLISCGPTVKQNCAFGVGEILEQQPLSSRLTSFRYFYFHE